MRDGKRRSEEKDKPGDEGRKKKKDKKKIEAKDLKGKEDKRPAAISWREAVAGRRVSRRAASDKDARLVSVSIPLLLLLCSLPNQVFPLISLELIHHCNSQPATKQSPNGRWWVYKNIILKLLQVFKELLLTLKKDLEYFLMIKRCYSKKFSNASSVKTL